MDKTTDGLHKKAVHKSFIHVTISKVLPALIF